MNGIKTRLEAITEHKSWVIVGGLLGILLATGLSGLADLAAGKPIGATMRANLEHPDPLAMIASLVFALFWFWATIATYRRKPKC